ncbi:MAG: hypothetical protein EOO56_22780 [Hymenobacter sp.]|nr:MAG: hypothetical protein EOO56_22780 [Hymenobacter sp.]
MSYCLHITRKAKGWNDERDPATISREEWLHYLAEDPSLERNDYLVDPEYGHDEAGDRYVEGLAAWLGHSGKGLNGGYVWFSHDENRITVTDPDEETLGKTLAVAQALHARVQGDDGEYFDQLDQPYATGTDEDVLAWASSDFRDFQTFASAGAAEPLLAALTRQGLNYHTSVDNGQLAFDPSFANNQLISRFIVKVRLADFERASQVLADLNQHALDQVAPDHYLFSFTDEELFDLLVKPDEWSALDVALAGQLLRQRGRDISPDTLRLLRQHRVAELTQPDQDHRAWVAGGYIMALLGGLFGVMIGYQLYFHRKQLPDGRRVYAYSATDRVHGLRILVLGVVCLLFWTLLRLSNYRSW